MVSVSAVLLPVGKGPPTTKFSNNLLWVPLLLKANDGLAPYKSEPVSVNPIVVKVFPSDAIRPFPETVPPLSVLEVLIWFQNVPGTGAAAVPV